ncbi:MAG TPA: hypothetical protein VLJ37_09590 [bacterium]|nr:hypothetical protein [bacterium]
MTLRTLLSLLPMAGMLLLTACPQMTTSPIGAPGSPLSAVGEEKTTSEKVPDSEEAIAPPSAAAPIPPSAVSGGGDPAGTTPPPMEPAFRRIDGGGVGGETPTTISGPVAAGDRGLISAPSSREAIDNPDDNLRIVYFPNGAPRRWTNSSEFLRDMTEAQAAAAKARVLSFVICPPCEIDPSWPYVVRSEDEIPGGGLVTEPGYYLFFTIKDELIERGFLLLDLGPSLPDEWVPVTSVAHLKGLVEDDRLKFLGDRTISARLIIDPSVLRRALPVPQTGPVPTLREPVLIPR